MWEPERDQRQIVSHLLEPEIIVETFKSRAETARQSYHD